jgi:dipeptidyl aminopeptidase/acylaminoacyl peptidase
MPEGGWPAIIFNHGYIPPEEYVREQKYLAYTAGFARAGYVVFMSDYRGHQDSEGIPEGGYYSPAYTRDVLYGLSAVEQLPTVNKDKIGMWGHSMGGHVTLRSMVVSDKIKVGVIWAGVVTSYEDMRENWMRRRSWQPSEREMTPQRRRLTDMIALYGEPDDTLPFWQAISPIFHLGELDGPIQLHHGTADAEVPVLFSQRLDEALAKAGKGHEIYIYEGADHNLSGSAFTPAMQRSISFFDSVLK